jgi:hypothetical protein
VPKPYSFVSLGLALSEKQIPQVIEIIENGSERVEPLERGGVLAKQMLSQLSYTPTARVSIILMHPALC